MTATGTGSTINSGTGVAFDMSGVTVGASGMLFDSTTKAAGGTSAVILSGVTGRCTINLGGGALGGGSGPTIRVGDGAGGANTGGTAGLTYSGSIASSTAGRTIDIQDRAASAQNITLSGNITHNVAGQTGIFLDDNAAGTITFSGTSKSITSGTAAAIIATDNTGATINFINGGLAITADVRHWLPCDRRRHDQHHGRGQQHHDHNRPDRQLDRRKCWRQRRDLRHAHIDRHGRGKRHLAQQC